VAEKVESVADFKRCVDHGFDLFQGYYFSEPDLLRRPARPAGTRSASALHAALLDKEPGLDMEPGIDVGRLEAIMSSDPSLAFRLLAAVNANAFGLDRNVGSLDQAMNLLGPDKLRCLAELIALSGDTIDDDIHIERGAVRARMAAELLADTELAGSGVTVALLSTADSVYGASMADLLTELPVTEEITAALLHGHGRLGITLDIIRACERNDMATLEDLAPGRHAELTALREAAIHAGAVDAGDRVRP
jgi:EAL and modified HD-GYP domain-containing signal transduction protein